MKPVVALVGRPNVGKSALFNRLVQKRISIVEDTPGVTRDRVYSESDWNGREFVMIDTGGFESEAKDMALMVRAQAEEAMREADVVVFVVDARSGLAPTDRDVAQVIRAGSRKAILAVNKVDDPGQVKNVAEFYALGLGEPIPVSAVHGTGTGDLLDVIVEMLPAQEEEPERTDTIRIAIVGRPNVGKSSLVNALVGEERMIVSAIPGTTRDAVDVEWTPQSKSRFTIIDTAGLRRKGKIELPLERFSAGRSLQAVDRSDVVLLMVDATEGVLEQDKRIAGYAHRQGKAAAILVNKWDLIEDRQEAQKMFEGQLRYKINFLDYAPIEFISALTKMRLNRLPELVEKVYAAHSRKVRTSELNKVVQDAVRVSPPPSVGGKQLNVFYGTQVKQNPPTFLFFVNNAEFVVEPYQRYLEDRLRGVFDFEGSPIRLVFRSRTRE